MSCNIPLVVLLLTSREYYMHLDTEVTCTRVRSLFAQLPAPQAAVKASCGLECLRPPFPNGEFAWKCLLLIVTWKMFKSELKKG